MAKARIFTVEEKRKMEQMAFDQCQDKTIAAVLGCDVSTLKKPFSTVLHKKRCEGKAALRRSQMKQSGNNPTMSIWLGKQYLEQKDKSEMNVRGEMKINCVMFGKKK